MNVILGIYKTIDPISSLNPAKNENSNSLTLVGKSGADSGCQSDLPLP